MNLIKNPILPGAYPDPSIVRVGDDFYLVNSSFEFFPGLPIHHSKDLVNWALIGHGIDRFEQLADSINLIDVESDGGIHAPSIRYHQGRFYIICTNVYHAPDGQETHLDNCTNFIITADHPGGPWSEPIVVKDAPGIDPDIFFDDDDTIWYVGTHTPEVRADDSEGEIWIQRLDNETLQLTGERHPIWRGTGGIWVEGPHLYKRNGRYYLMCAEGGTGYCHAVTVASSQFITGPYHSNDRNPILTSRNLAHDNWVHSTGHGDLVELADGRTYMVCLGVRNHVYHRTNMGRETFLVPVMWERGPRTYDNMYRGADIEWPVCAPDTGRVEPSIKAPFETSIQHRELCFFDDFSQDSLGHEWLFRRAPSRARYELMPSSNTLRLLGNAQRLEERQQSAFIGIRQRSSIFSFCSEACLDPRVPSESGIAVVQKDDKFVSLTAHKEGDYAKLQVTLTDQVIARCSTPWPHDNRFIFTITCEADRYSFQCQTEHTHLELGEWQGKDLLSMNYSGALCGLYCVSIDGEQAWCDFSSVRYIGQE